MEKNLKRTGFKRKTTKPMKRTKIRVVGKSTTAEIKKDIQALLREVVMLRDGRCILYGQKCMHKIGDEGIVWQAEHLIERSNSATFADSRLVVLIAKNCHGWKHFKKSNHDMYDAMVKKVLPKERVELWEKCEANSWKPTKTTSYDWMLAKIVLERELSELQAKDK